MTDPHSPAGAPHPVPKLAMPEPEPHPSQTHHSQWRIYMGEFWAGDLGLTLLLISLVMQVFVITPMLETGVPGRMIFNLIVMVLMVSAAIVGTKSRFWRGALLVAVVASTIAVVVARLEPSHLTHLWASATVTITQLLFVRVVIVVMFRGGPITWSRIQGGVAAYLLIGMAFASAFEFLELYQPYALAFVTQPHDLDQLTAKCTYFSFTVLTTVGSAIEPTNTFARSLTTAEAIIGQLFPTILIGALVAMAIESRSRNSNSSSQLQ
jgi:hypothetical protein